MKWAGQFVTCLEIVFLCLNRSPGLLGPEPRQKMRGQHLKTAVGVGKLGASYGDEADFCLSELKMSGERGELHFFFITAYQQ